MKPVDHEVFDPEREKYVKQLPLRDTSLTINIQVDSDVLLATFSKANVTLAKYCAKIKLIKLTNASEQHNISRANKRRETN